MKITKRSVNTKRHNVAFKIGGTWRTRREAVNLARSGKIDGAHVCQGPTCSYIRMSKGFTPIDEMEAVSHETLRSLRV